MTYAVTLEKYQPGGRNRYPCPQCGKAKKFTRYIDTATGEYIADDVGKCDRESKCGYHYTPAQYRADNPNANSRRDAWRQSEAHRTRYQPPAQEPEQTPQVLPEWLFEETQTTPDCNFVKFLESVFGSVTARALRQKFHIGSNSDLWPGSTVFWVLGADAQPYSGQVVNYNPTTGKRIKNNWIHIALKSRYNRTGQPLPEWLQDYQDNAPKYPFPFGLHLLPGSEGQPVAIVEAAKTAVVMSAIAPDALWLAIGGLSYLNADRLTTLQGRELVLYPDLGAYDKWSAKAAELRCLGFSVAVSDLLELNAEGEDHVKGYDIADYFLKNAAAPTVEVKG